MKIIDLISGTQGTAFSFEILPPLKGTGTVSYTHLTLPTILLV